MPAGRRDGGGSGATVSVVIPAFNAASFLAEALESVFSQTRPPDEVVVVDDGSTDGTRQILSSYRDRVKAITQSNSGPARARNRGIAASTGRYIAFLDADDTWRPEKLALQMAMLLDSPECGLVYSQWIEVKQDSGREGAACPEPVRQGFLFDELLVESFILLSSVVVPRDVFERVGVFNEELFTAEDTHLYLRIARKYPVAAVSQPLVRRWKHKHNLSDRFDIPVGSLACLDKIVRLFPDTAPAGYTPMKRAYLSRGAALMRDYLFSGYPARARRTAMALVGRGCLSSEVVYLWIKSWLPQRLPRQEEVGT